MYDKILIPIDGSEVSAHAALEGFALAKMLGAEVNLLYVVDYAVLTMPDAETTLSNMEVIRKSFTTLGEKAIGELSATAKEKGVKVKAVISEGDVHDEIIKAAEDLKASLVIMGTHGRRGLNRLLLGSVAESVARRAHCAVLLIRPE